MTDSPGRPPVPHGLAALVTVALLLAIQCPLHAYLFTEVSTLHDPGSAFELFFAALLVASCFGAAVRGAPLYLAAALLVGIGASFSTRDHQLAVTLPPVLVALGLFGIGGWRLRAGLQVRVLPHLIASRGIPRLALASSLVILFAPVLLAYHLRNLQDPEQVAQKLLDPDPAVHNHALFRLRVLAQGKARAVYSTALLEAMKRGPIPGPPVVSNLYDTLVDLVRRDPLAGAVGEFMVERLREPLEEPERLVILDRLKGVAPRTPATVRLLVSQLDIPEVRERALETLGSVLDSLVPDRSLPYRGTAFTRAELEAHLDAESARDLAALGPEAASLEAALLKLAPQYGPTGTGSLLRLLRGFGNQDPAIQQVLASMLRSPDDGIRITAALHLAGSGAHVPAVAAVLDAPLPSPSWSDWIALGRARMRDGYHRP